jgi:hypothetical protein
MYNVNTYSWHHISIDLDTNTDMVKDMVKDTDMDRGQRQTWSRTWTWTRTWNGILTYARYPNGAIVLRA